MLDSIEILISEANTFSAQLSLRTLFEIDLYIRWILKEKTKLRCKQFYIWNFRNKKRWSLRILPGTDENRFFKDITEKYGDTFNKYNDPKLIEQNENIIAEIDDVLNKEQYKDINNEFEGLKRKRNFEVNWYVPNGVNSLCKMAEDVDLLSEYKVFYSSLSQITHPTEMFKKVQFLDKKIVFEPIRDLKGSDLIFRLAFNFAVGMYRRILEFYRPSEIQNFSKKYVSE